MEVSEIQKLIDKEDIEDIFGYKIYEERLRCMGPSLARRVVAAEKQIEALRSCLSACVSLMEENMDCATPSASRRIKEAATLMEKTNE